MKYWPLTPSSSLLEAKKLARYRFFAAPCHLRETRDIMRPARARPGAEENYAHAIACLCVCVHACSFTQNVCARSRERVTSDVLMRCHRSTAYTCRVYLEKG